MLFLTIYILHINFCAILFNKSRYITIQKILENLWQKRPPIKQYHKNLYQLYLLTWVYCMQIFVWFHAIEPKIELLGEIGEKQNSSAPYWAICTQSVSFSFLMMDILYFCAISSTRNRVERNQIVFKTSQSVEIYQKPEVENFHGTNTFFYLHRRK